MIYVIGLPKGIWTMLQLKFVTVAGTQTDWCREKSQFNHILPQLAVECSQLLCNYSLKHMSVRHLPKITSFKLVLYKN